MSAEEWRWIPAWEGLYEVSSCGRVRSWTRIKKGALLKVVRARNGYMKVGLQSGRERKQVEVHRLVAAAFFGPQPQGIQVRHLDGSRDNNNVENLAYGTPAENMADKLVHGTDRASRNDTCLRGHPFSDENTYRRPGNPKVRQCRECLRIRGRRRKPWVPVPLSGPDDPRHGTSTGYGGSKCRCERCKGWAKIYQAAQRARRKAA